MQSNNWKKDSEILSEAYSTVSNRIKDDEVLNELAPLVGVAARAAAPLIAKGAKAVAPRIAKGAKVAAQAAGAAVGNAVVDKFSKDDEPVEAAEDGESHDAAEFISHLIDRLKMVLQDTSMGEDMDASVPNDIKEIGESLLRLADDLGGEAWEKEHGSY